MKENLWKIARSSRLGKELTVLEILELSNISKEFKGFFQEELRLANEAGSVKELMLSKNSLKRMAYMQLVGLGEIDPSRYWNPCIGDYYDTNPTLVRKMDYAYKDGHVFIYRGDNFFEYAYG